MKKLKLFNWIVGVGIAIPLLLITHAVSASPFIDNLDHTVTDRKTGLIWERCSMGQELNNISYNCSGTATTATWANALTYCNGLTLAGRTWRLPNINELTSIVDRSKASGATIDLTVFPATVANNYWSSSTYVPNASFAWLVFFSNGLVTYNNKSNNKYVRCVSTGP